MLKCLILEDYIYFRNQKMSSKVMDLKFRWVIRPLPILTVIYLNLYNVSIFPDLTNS